MIQNGMYFGKENLYQIIRSLGGVWNDSKERPLVCLIKSVENDDLYWAIPVGNWNHRTPKAQARIQSFLSRPTEDISSCFYHVGNTTVKSIFFISDAIPITDKYIEREYLNTHTKKIHIIQNKVLLAELERKLKRILAWENSNPDFFRQHITTLKNYLTSELAKEKTLED